MSGRTSLLACADARSGVSGGRTGGWMGMTLVTGVLLALLVANAGREPRFRELGLVVGG